MTKKIRLIIFLILLLGFAVWSWWAMFSPPSPEQLTARIKLLENVYQYGNYIEAVIWGLFAGGFLINGKGTEKKSRRNSYIAAVVFFLFGLSDIVEVQTGAWWRPWWLFIWKASCVAAMLRLLLLYLGDRSFKDR